MFEAKVTIDAPELAAAINNLAAALKPPTRTLELFDGSVRLTEAAESSGVVDCNTPAEVAQTPTAPEKEAAKATQPKAEPAQPVKTYTIDDLSRAGAELIDQGKMPKLIEILNKHGVQAITQLKPEQYGTVATELNALGAKL